MLLEAGDGSFNDVALLVAHRIDQGGRPPLAPWRVRAACWSERSGMVWAIRRWRSNRRQVV
jgi:hypothetical protein